MKKLRLLGTVLKQTKADKILLSYLVFVLLLALVICLFDPKIETYGDSLWYCCAVISTCGFGDLVATTLLTKIATVLLMAYSVIVIAIFTGVIVNFYNQLIQLRQKETLSAFIRQLENLPQLSKEELEDLSLQVKKFQNKA